MQAGVIGSATLALALTALAGCSAPSPTSQASTASFNTEIPLNEVMAHAMSPAAYQFWGGWGTKATLEGVIDLAPKNEAEWKRVEDGAVTVLLLTNIIKLQGYARPPLVEWNSAADRVASVAERARQAAERQDKDAIGVIGAELDVACEACHERFITEYR